MPPATQPITMYKVVPDNTAAIEFVLLLLPCIVVAIAVVVVVIVVELSLSLLLLESVIETGVGDINGVVSVAVVVVDDVEL